MKKIKKEMLILFWESINMKLAGAGLLLCFCGLLKIEGEEFSYFTILLLSGILSKAFLDIYRKWKEMKIQGREMSMAYKKVFYGQFDFVESDNFIIRRKTDSQSDILLILKKDSL